jgi:hypothetical protein
VIDNGKDTSLLRNLSLFCKLQNRDDLDQMSLDQMLWGQMEVNQLSFLATLKTNKHILI